MDEITVTAPATVSNVVCGFDCLGFALDTPRDRFTLRRTAEKGIRIINKDDFGLPADADSNIAGVTLNAMLDASGADFGFEFESEKSIKPGSGIGSSAASACGAAVAANGLLGGGFSTDELVDFALRGEVLASAARHADNVAPCILGGFTLVRSVDPLDVVRLSHPDLYATVIHPQIEVKTSQARGLLPQEVPLGMAVRAWSNLGAFVAALTSGDRELMGRSMVDEIVEPARKSLIPMFDELHRSSLAAGALGGGISGSGPSVFMLSRDRDTAVVVEKEMQNLYARTGIEFRTYVSAVAPEGVRIEK
jgi:homoserine kinase